MVATFVSGIDSPRVESIGSSAPTVPLTWVSALLTFDRTWSPYIQGQLVATQLSASQAVTADPRTGFGCKFALTQQLDGGPVQSLPIAAWLRSRASDYGSGTTTFAFASLESLMQDHTDPTGQQYAADPSDTDVIRDALGYLRWQGAGYPVEAVATTLDGTASFGVAKATATWAPGTTLWDAVQEVEQLQSVWLRGDESGLRLVRSGSGYVADTSTRSISDADRILSMTESIDRGNPDWANAAFIVYPNANYATDSALAATQVPYKSFVDVRDGKVARLGGAAGIASRMVKRGRVLNVTAIADLTTRPNQRYTVKYGADTFTAVVQAVTFRWPEGLMDMTMNVIES